MMIDKETEGRVAEYVAANLLSCFLKKQFLKKLRDETASIEELDILHGRIIEIENDFYEIERSLRLGVTDQSFEQWLHEVYSTLNQRSDWRKMVKRYVKLKGRK